MKTAADWIKDLGLQSHPEGGWFRETYRAQGKLPSGRNYSTAIYFLLEAGQPLLIKILGATTIELSAENPQAVAPAGRWFGARLAGDEGYALVGCTVAPGFDFSDFEMGKRIDLLSQFPQHKDIIMELTPDER